MVMFLLVHLSCWWWCWFGLYPVHSVITAVMTDLLIHIANEMIYRRIYLV